MVNDRRRFILEAISSVRPIFRRRFDLRRFYLGRFTRGVFILYPMAIESAISVEDEPLEFELYLRKGQTLLIKNISGIQQRKDTITRVSNSRRH